MASTRLPSGDAAGHLAELAHGGAHRDLVDAGTLHVARERDELQPAAAADAARAPGRRRLRRAISGT